MRKFLFIAAAFFAAPLQANEGYEWEAEHIHSDLPLYTFDWDDLWPRSMTAPDIIAGCTSRVAFGDWAFKPNPDDESGDPYWIRVSNYGAFHCAANLRVSDARENLNDGRFSQGLFAKIGKARKGENSWELWVLQEGFVPGSDYLLLAREADDESVVDEFTVLQRRCPKRAIRETRSLDIWGGRYCSINSQRELLSLAKRMLREPPLGTLTRHGKKVPDTEVPDPSKSQASD
jgi:hypothetical protein